MFLSKHSLKQPLDKMSNKQVEPLDPHMAFSGRKGLCGAFPFWYNKLCCGEIDVVSLEALYKEYGDRLYNLLLRMLGDVDDALDALQQTFLRAHRALRSFREDSQPYTWLYRIALNCAYTMLKRRQRRRVEVVAGG